MSKNKSIKVISKVNKNPFKNESAINRISNIPHLQNGDKISIEGTKYGNKITGTHRDNHTNTYIFKERTPLASGGYKEEIYNVPCGSYENIIQDILDLHNSGIKQNEIAKRLGISQSFISKILNQYND